MKKLLIVLMSVTAILTACNNNVGGKPTNTVTPSKPDIKPWQPLTFNYPQDGYYLNKQRSKGILIKNKRIQAIYWGPYVAFHNLLTSNRVDTCVVAMMMEDKEESHNKVFAATNCKSESNAYTITITPRIGNESNAQPIVFLYDHKIGPTNK